MKKVNFIKLLEKLKYYNVNIIGEYSDVNLDDIIKLDDKTTNRIIDDVEAYKKYDKNYTGVKKYLIEIIKTWIYITNNSEEYSDEDIDKIFVNEKDVSVLENKEKIMKVSFINHEEKMKRVDYLNKYDIIKDNDAISSVLITFGIDKTEKIIDRLGYINTNEYYILPHDCVNLNKYLNSDVKMDLDTCLNIVKESRNNMLSQIYIYKYYEKYYGEMDIDKILLGAKILNKCNEDNIDDVYSVLDYYNKYNPKFNHNFEAADILSSCSAEKIDICVKLYNYYKNIYLRTGEYYKSRMLDGLKMVAATKNRKIARIISVLLSEVNETGFAISIDNIKNIKSELEVAVKENNNYNYKDLEILTLRTITNKQEGTVDNLLKLLENFEYEDVDKSSIKKVLFYK